MNLGLGLGLSYRGGGLLDPATLALTGWWRANFSASPWVGSTSAGGSGSRNATEATNPPSVGALVNGLAPADFDGVNDLLTIATATNFITTTLHSGWALVWIDIVDTNNATLVLNDSILAAASGFFSIYLRSTGEVGFAHGTQAGPTVASTSTIATGGWHLVHWRLTGGNLQIGVDGVWASTVAGDMSSSGLAQSIMFGRNTNGTAFFDGRIADIAMSKVDVFTGTGLTDVKAYINSRYGLAL